MMRLSSTLSTTVESTNKTFFYFAILVDPNFNETPVFTEETIKNYKYPFRDMALEVLDDF